MRFALKRQIRGRGRKKVPSYSFSQSRGKRGKIKIWRSAEKLRQSIFPLPKITGGVKGKRKGTSILGSVSEKKERGKREKSLFHHHPDCPERREGDLVPFFSHLNTPSGEERKVTPPFPLNNQEKQKKGFCPFCLKGRGSPPPPLLMSERER